MSTQVDRLNQSATLLVGRARQAMGWTQQMLGDALGVSKRTAHRWEGGRATPSVAEVRTLAGLVFPRDPSLAAELAAAASTTLVELGLSQSQSVTSPVRLVVQAVVCVAADELACNPQPVRRALHAAFKCARELGLSMEDVEKALEPEGQKPARIRSRPASEDR
jgi:transcriptional regulator with XRE-family HTH domain